MPLIYGTLRSPPPLFALCRARVFLINGKQQRWGTLGEEAYRLILIPEMASACERIVTVLAVVIQLFKRNWSWLHFNL